MTVIIQETIVVPAQLDELEALHTTLERFWVAVDAAVLHPPDSLWRMKFAIAVAEIGANIMQHAYRAEGLQGALSLRLRFCINCVEARFTDQGAAFTGTLIERSSPLEVDGIWPSNVDIASLPESGYGLALVHGLVDDVQYWRTRGGINCWRLRKHILA